MFDFAKQNIQYLRLQYTYLTAGSAAYWNEKALVFIKQNKAEEALECVEKALLEDRKNIVAIEHKMWLLLGKKKLC